MNNPTKIRLGVFRAPLLISVLFLFCLMTVLPLRAYATPEILEQIDSFVKNNELQKTRADLLRKYGLLINPYFKTAFEFTRNVFSAPDSERKELKTE